MTTALPRILGATLIAGATSAGLTVAGAARHVQAQARGRLFGEPTVPATPAGVVLGAQVLPSGLPSPFLAARLEVALRMYVAGKVGHLVVSGDSNAPEYDEPLAMRRYLLAAGVPAEAITDDPDGYDTYETCLRARDVYGLRRFTLISQTYHLPRAVGTARLLGLDAVGVGDRSVRIQPSGRPSRSWRSGVVREQVACVKTLIDLRYRLSPRS